MIIDSDEARRLASQSLLFLKANQSRSSIANRGAALIESLLEIDSSVTNNKQSQFSLKSIISRVVGCDQSLKQNHDQYVSCDTPLIDLVAGDFLPWQDISDLFIQLD